jgi:hypothetical protein
MQDVGVKFLFQPPGYTVFSLPGRVFHWTTSLGFSLAEAANFYTSLSDINLSQVKPFGGQVVALTCLLTYVHAAAAYGLVG